MLWPFSQWSSPVLLICIIKKEYDTFAWSGFPKNMSECEYIAVLTEATKTPTMTPKDVEVLLFERLEVLTVALLWQLWRKCKPIKRPKFSVPLGPKLSFAENQKSLWISQTVTCKANLTHLERRCSCKPLLSGLNTLQNNQRKRKCVHSKWVFWSTTMKALLVLLRIHKRSKIHFYRFR